MANSKKTEKRALIRFFEIIFTKASKLMLLNVIYFICILPLLYFGISMTLDMFCSSEDIIFISNNFYFIDIIIRLFVYMPQGVSYALIIVSLIVYGPLTAGYTYCIRNIATGQHFWMSDLFHRSVSNFKQGLVFGIIDVLVFLSCIMYLSPNSVAFAGMNPIMHTVLKIIVVIATIVYIFIRFYSYAMAVTVELSIKDIFKNALLFCVLGFFRNILAIAVCAFIMFTFVSTPKIDIVLIGVLVFSLCRYTAMFATFPIIDEYILAEIRRREKAEKKAAKKALKKAEEEPEESEDENDKNIEA